MKPEKFIKPLVNTALTGALIYVASNAFSRKSRLAIIRRDGNCVDRDDTCVGRLEASHIDHTKDTEWYDDPDNGEALCVKHHLDRHIQEHGQNGLTPEGNKWAIQRLTERLTQYLEP